jgi:hypothetical protein
MDKPTSDLREYELVIEVRDDETGPGVVESLRKVIGPKTPLISVEVSKPQKTSPGFVVKVVIALPRSEDNMIVRHAIISAVRRHPKVKWVDMRAMDEITGAHARLADRTRQEIEVEIDADGLPAEFRLWVDAGDAPPSVVADVLIALSDLHRAYGGPGLQYEVDGDGVLVVQEAEEVV